MPESTVVQAAQEFMASQDLPEFDVRSEIDAFMSEDGPFASSPVQRGIVLIGP